MPPSIIGPYRVLDTLGAGGAGTVYRALDRRTNEPVALKLLSSGPALDPKAARRLAREFETLADLSHRNVVKVFDTGVFQGYPYLAMELVEGLTLRHYLSVHGGSPFSSSTSSSFPGRRASAFLLDDSLDGSSLSSDASDSGAFGMSDFNEEPASEDAGSFGTRSSGPDSLRALADLADEPDTQESMDGSLPFEVPTEPKRPATPAPDAVNLDELNRPERVGRLKDSMVQLCNALSYIHAHGLIHRDLKPSNVMVDEDRLVRLMDFGLAKFLADDSQVTQGNRMVGTYRYMAPEQILGEPLDARADLYSLGVIMYELLTGRPPFDAPTPYELWQKVLESKATPILVLNPRCDSQVARVAHRLMRKEPDERYQTAEEVAEALSE